MYDNQYAIASDAAERQTRLHVPQPTAAHRKQTNEIMNPCDNVSVIAYRNRDGVVSGKFQDEFAAGFFLGLVEGPHAAYHLDVALVSRRHHSAQSCASLPLTR